MDALQFAYWLQGFAELNGGTPPNETQWKAIKDHLSLVFNKVTPNYPGLGQDWQKEIIKDYKPAPPPVYYNVPPYTLKPLYTVTCSSGQPNTQTAFIC